MREDRGLKATFCSDVPKLAFGGVSWIQTPFFPLVLNRSLVQNVGLVRSGLWSEDGEWAVGEKYVTSCHHNV